MQLSDRAQSIDPFYVMQVAKQAAAIERDLPPGAPRMIYLCIGEPDFSAPESVQAAANAVIAKGTTQYTEALGLLALRQKISGWYQQRFGVAVSPQRIVITAGASAALQLACLAFVNPGEEVLMPDPSYPCNRHILTASSAKAVLLPTTAEQRYQLSAQDVADHWGERTRGVLLASPSNPTGTSIDPQEMQQIMEVVRLKGGVTLLDEIYLGLGFDERYGQTALAYTDEVVSINSFSKYFNMTGWRLGWLVLPERLVPQVEALAQNLYICASTVAQHAALACFEDATIAEYERRRAEFKARRDYFIPALRELGFGVPLMPDGAFYAWADASPLFERLGVSDSSAFVDAVMRRAHLVLTPSRDFSDRDLGTHVRFSTASSMQDLQEAIARLRSLLA
jgi:aspartate/methionine/tyrosine aminotransferase